MRLFLHELGAVFECVRRDNLDPSFKMLARISRLQEELLGAWSVLSTLTPFEYSAFRNTLGRSSGFQSHQYRMLEFMLGNKNRDVIAVHKRDEANYEKLERALKAPSIYDEVLRLLSRRGYGIPEELLDRDFTEPYTASKGVTAAWLSVYHNAEKDWDLYELAERLTDLDQKFQLWRFHHLKTVERVIGYKPGTGGTGGVSYLAKALELKFFPELWHVRTSM
jgi:tryptophan 2,3-dioxygenase